MLSREGAALQMMLTGRSDRLHGALNTLQISRKVLSHARSAQGSKLSKASFLAELRGGACRPASAAGTNPRGGVC